MGGSHPKPKTDIFMTVPPTSPEPCLLSHLKKEHLLLAFFAGALLTLLLLAFVFLSMKSCRRCHSSSQALDSHSDPPTKGTSHETFKQIQGLFLELWVNYQ
ncbi:transmembrane protein C1orf162 homolog isoform X2 [Perognathus longimembris pacificus]|uniref:transmembrane protein C1orf162 homolog isoform X2 n=1 Tax=Perognathus longimembris pacificus TaxID=214514 RepID=UPI0020195FD3|nr:transmembrane protein C1orf162 homolog isoform X2 [Perognathus longimembris pacificus]